MIGCFHNLYCPATENMQSDQNEILNIFAQNEQCVYFMVFAFMFLVVSDITSLYDNKIQVHAHTHHTYTTHTHTPHTHTHAHTPHMHTHTRTRTHTHTHTHTRLSAFLSMSSFARTATFFIPVILLSCLLSREH
jgi:ABC-type nickel/cobalt efflux system permease component RcnA